VTTAAEIGAAVEARPLAELLSAFADYLALDDTTHIVFALAVAVAAHLDDGEPLWGLLVGAPAGGKTETLRALDDVADEHLDEITGPGLLSWSKTRPPRPTGLLARRQGPVFATIGDLSTLLAMSDRGVRDQLYALLRRAFDGSVTREVGNAPGPLRWEGRLTLLAAVTPQVDRYATHADALGPRWLYLRSCPPTSTSAARRAESHAAQAANANTGNASATLPRSASRRRSPGSAEFTSPTASASSSTTPPCSPAAAAPTSPATATAAARSSASPPSRSRPA
jgi:hypothetical protein